MEPKLEQVLPGEIEKRSFAIIESELPHPLPPTLAPIIKRVIHTTADFDYADTLCFSDGVVEQTLAALRRGASIVTDTNMGKAGINKTVLGKFGGQVHCFMADADVAERAKAEGTTRAVASMRKAAAMGEDFIYAVGNAPTALVELHRLMEADAVHPLLIIGVPVGFVNVVPAKELILQGSAPYIVAKGRKGGSNVAAAICNALLYLADGR